MGESHNASLFKALASFFRAFVLSCTCVLMISLQRKATLVQIMQVSTKQMELETAKEILAEVFHACPSDAENMIHNRLEECSCRQDEEKDCDLLPSVWVRVSMGRSFESVRMGDKNVSARWLKPRRALKKEDQAYRQKLAEMARKHSGEAF